MTTVSQRIFAIIKGTEEEKEQLDKLIETNHAEYDRLVLKIWERNIK